MRGEPITIYGDGSQTRSFTYVDDEIRGFLALLDSDITTPVNIGNPTEYTIRQLAEMAIDVTEEWAQVAVAGPRARELLNGVLAAPVDDAGFPFMACGEAVVGGVAGRLFRISFSGEQAYELAKSQKPVKPRKK